MERWVHTWGDVYQELSGQGGINALSSAIDNLGNPFFSECEVDVPWTAGREINDDV